MTKLAVTYPDVERLVTDYLAAELGEGDWTVGVPVPAGWGPDSPTHIQVALDGTPSLAHPILARSTIRLVARAQTTTAAKAAANKALGVLCAHPGDGQITGARPLTGVLPDRDPDTGADLASVTARVSVRSTPIT